MDLKKISLPNLKKMDKKLMARLMLGLGVIVAIVLIIIIVKLIVGNRVSYGAVEDKMITAAKEYYSNSEEGINSFKDISTKQLSVNIETLTEEGYLKNVEKIIPDKDITCSGKVTVKMNNGYTLYTPYLDCGENYKTKSLKEVITANTVDKENGLYVVGNEYVFRGEDLNNYVSFANKTWLIIKVKENGNIKLIETTKREKVKWDDRYNLDEGYNSGINDFDVSRIKDSLTALYENEEEFTENDKGYIVPTNLCIGKRSEKETTNDGSIECSSVVENWLIGLIQLNEYLSASLDTNCHAYSDRSCENYNYFTSLELSYWSITTSADKTNKVYKLNPSPFLTDAANDGSIRAVIELDGNSVYVSGDGTLEAPYIFK